MAKKAGTGRAGVSTSGGEGGARRGTKDRPDGALAPRITSVVDAALASILGDAWTATSRSRKNLRLIEQAAQFPVTPEVRLAMVAVATKDLASDKPRVRAAANKALAALTAQNQSDRHHADDLEVAKANAVANLTSAGLNKTYLGLDPSRV